MQKTISKKSFINKLFDKLFSFGFCKKQRKNRYPREIENTTFKSTKRDFVPVLRINITNYYNCITYQQIHRATDRIFKNDIFLSKYRCPSSKEISAVTGNSHPIINRDATSAYFANYVLESLDNNFRKYCSSLGVNYFRRYDDIFLIGNREISKKIANFICKQLQDYNFTIENDKNYLSFKDKIKIKEILKTESQSVIKYYMNYIKNVDKYYYDEVQRYACA